RAAVGGRAAVGRRTAAGGAGYATWTLVERDRTADRSATLGGLSRAAGRAGGKARRQAGTFHRRPALSPARRRHRDRPDRALGERDVGAAVDRITGRVARAARSATVSAIVV